MYSTVTTSDHVTNPGLDLVKLEAFLTDIDYQPRWLAEAQRCADYYDGKQLDTEVLRVMKSRGMPPLVFNLIAPAIDGVLGMEEKTRTDWICRADNDSGLEVAEALNEKLNEATRITDANRACSDAYAAEVKAGLGWVEVNRNPDPFGPNYRCNYVHRREIHWDWYAKRPDLSDARYLVRSKWVDEDQAITAFPQHVALVKAAVNGWTNWFQTFQQVDMPVELSSAYQDYLMADLSDREYFDYGRKRLKVYEVWYRTWQSGTVIKLKSGRVIEFDKGNVMHRAAIAAGHAQPVTGMYPKMRLSFFLGPHRVQDIPSPLPHGHFPYIPFWGFREDSTGVPYGMIRRMLSPQDEVNARRSKMMWLLTAKRVIMDRDATEMTMEEVLDEASRADGIILLNPSRQNRDKDAFRIEQDFQLAAQQFDVMKDAEEMVQNASGIYNAMLGRNEGDQSGVALSSLIEQSSTTLAELNGNYRYSRRLVGEHHLALVVQDLGRNPEEVVINANRPQKTKRIKLNERIKDESGNVVGINNDVALTKTQVVMDEITATPGYRAQIANRIMDIIGTLPDELKGPLMPLAIEATDIPQRDKMAQVLNKVLGTDIDPEQMDDEERAQYEAEQQEKAKLRKQQFDEIQSKIDKTVAEAGKIRAETESKEVSDRKTAADMEKTQVETQQILQQMQALTEEIGLLKKQMIEGIDADNEIMAAEEMLAKMEVAKSAKAA